MKITRLELTNFRVFERATFDFQPGMNLIVGINGVGKSSVLDALRILLSRALPQFTASKGRVPLRKYDVTVGRDALTAELHFATCDIPFICEVERLKEKQAGRRLSLVRLKPNSREIFRLIEENIEKPLALYFSPQRSLSTVEMPDMQTRNWGQAAAFAKALLRRRLRLREFAEWWLVQKALSQEQAGQRATRRLEILTDAVKQFLEDYTHLRAVGDLEVPFTWDQSQWDIGAKYDGGQLPTLLLDKNDMTLDVRQLSDGERGLLALVFDLARRLSLANPELDNPLRDGKAVVLIDELDLHLHPRWQRTVVEKLTKTFPNCQFIATTHSPQIIGEVSPDKIILLESGQPPYRPDQSLGMDSNWILRYLMDANERDSDTKQKLSRIADLIDEEQYDKATTAIDTLRNTLGEFPELVRLQTRIDRIRLLEE